MNLRLMRDRANRRLVMRCVITRPGVATLTGLALTSTRPVVYDGPCLVHVQGQGLSDSLLAGRTVRTTSTVLRLPVGPVIHDNDDVQITEARDGDDDLVGKVFRVASVDPGGTRITQQVVLVEAGR